MFERKNCSILECEKLAVCRTWCTLHYQRWKKHGDPEKRVNLHRGTDEERLTFHGWTVTEAGCWEWAGGRFATGYGMLSGAPKPRLAHRIAYMTWVGPIPEGHVVRHRCDNRPCINPDHLETGTQADNVRDMHDRNRQPDISGERNHRSKLTNQVVKEIRRLAELGMSASQLGRDYGVSRRCVSNVIARRTWRNVE